MIHVVHDYQVCSTCHGAGYVRVVVVSDDCTGMVPTLDLGPSPFMDLVPLLKPLPPVRARAPLPRAPRPDRARRPAGARWQTGMRHRTWYGRRR